MSDGLPRDLFAGDPAEVERGLDEWVAGFERNAARYQELQGRVEDTRLTAASANGAVTVTVDTNGALTDVRFTDAIRDVSPEQLRQELLGTIRQATARIVGAVQEIAEDTLGPDAGDSAARITGFYSDRFADTAADSGELASARGLQDRGDGDDFGEWTTFTQGR